MFKTQKEKQAFKIGMIAGKRECGSKSDKPKRNANSRKATRSSRKK